MGLMAWLTLTVLLLVLVLLVATQLAPDMVLMGGLTILLVGGVLTPAEAFAGMANEGVITIGVLFVVASGMRETGGMHILVKRMLGQPRALIGAQARIMFPAAIMSAFMNNTPLVAMLMPVVSDWARRLRLSSSRLLLPLSYASIFGGACTLIGTSTNLIINGWLMEETGRDSMGMFEVAAIGIPIAVVGLAYLLVVGRKLLPERNPVLDITEDSRQYTVEMLVETGSPLVGKTIEAAGLRNLPGLFLVEIDRGEVVLPAVSGKVTLRGGDRLVFVGVVSSVVDLQQIRGLSVATDQIYKLETPRTNRALIEAVVSDTNPLVGQTIRMGRFRTRYSAAVIAVARNGARLSGKIGDIRLQPGDTLLLEARGSFATQQQNSRDFYLVSRIEGAMPPNHERAPIALLILLGMVTSVTLGWLSMLNASLLAAGAMLLGRCCRVNTARTSVDWQVLLVIAASLGLGKAIQTSGLAEVIASGLLVQVGDSTTLALALVFGITMILAAMVTAKAAAVLVLPICQVLAANMGVNLMPFVMAVMIAASTTVATPIGYPTNMMVMGPGGYRFRDYLVIGVPLTLIVWAMSIVLIPMFWSF